MQKLFELVKSKGLQPPVVVDADDLEENPQGILAEYCRRLDIEILPTAQNWKPGMPDEWKMWRNWHLEAAGSTGIRENRTIYDITVDNSDHLKRCCEHHLPFYRAMHRHRIRAAGN